MKQCTHRHHRSPASKSQEDKYFYQLCQCLNCEVYFTRFTQLDRRTMVYHVLRDKNLESTSLNEALLENTIVGQAYRYAV